MTTETVNLAISINMMWVVMGLIFIAGILGLIAWFKTGRGCMAFIAIGTILIAVSQMLPMFGVSIPILNYITWFAAPVLFGIGFFIAIKRG